MFMRKLSASSFRTTLHRTYTHPRVGLRVRCLDSEDDLEDHFTSNHQMSDNHVTDDLNKTDLDRFRQRSPRITPNRQDQLSTQSGNYIPSFSSTLSEDVEIQLPSDSMLSKSKHSEGNAKTDGHSNRDENPTLSYRTSSDMRGSKRTIKTRHFKKNRPSAGHKAVASKRPSSGPKTSSESIRWSCPIQTDEPSDPDDKLVPAMGELEPWPMATELKLSHDDLPESTAVVLRNRTEHLMNGLKEITLQLSRKNLEMQRLTAVNSQLGERYCRLRSQYMDLAREQMKLRQRHDALLVKAVERDKLSHANIQLEEQLNELQKKILIAEERDNQISRRLGRMESEARETALSSADNDLIVANLRQELERKDAQIEALKSRHHLDAAREIQARLILNELIEVKGIIRVIVRCYNPADSDDAFRNIGDDTLVLKSSLTLPCSFKHSPKYYKVHRVFPQNVTQRAVFEEVSELITSCVDGYSVSIASYGQTGTGKTYTMLGAPNKAGIIPRAIRHLITECKRRAPLWNYRLSIVIIQVHRETIYDLLAEPTRPTRTQELGHVSLHDNGKLLLLKDTIEKEFTDEEEVLAYLRKARARRQASIGLLKTTSSQLNFIVILRVRGSCTLASHGEEIHGLGLSQANSPTHEKNSPNKCKQSPQPNEPKPNTQFMTHGILMLADLAGFDHAGQREGTSSVATTESTNLFKFTSSDSDPPQNLKRSDSYEARASPSGQLGRSLIALERVFNCLLESKKRPEKHIPFRDSKLTHVLKPALSGDARFVLLINLNTHKSNLETSLRSLKLAAKASNIALGQAKVNSATYSGFRTCSGGTLSR